jgi:acyl-coenzyme A synthetase/AMP-(fatty) acid ligase
LEFLQRIDQQVKIRGFRIELGEIEVCVAEHPAVRDVVVIAWEAEPGEKQLVAYYTLADVHQGNVQRDELQRFVGERLPQYMIPSIFVPLVELPLNANGKVDR